MDGFLGLNATSSIAANNPPGSTGVIAELDEYAIEVIDVSMSQLGSQ
jgi:hypothetical protein